MSDTKDYKWYIVHTQNGYEKKIRERIDKRVKENGMEDLIVDIYIFLLKWFLLLKTERK